MKKILPALLMILALEFTVVAQIPVKESEVPESVKSKLPNLFPGVSGVQWTKHNTDYHANFVYDSIKVVSKFAESGRWIMSESEYPLKGCPRSMQKHVNSSFPESKLVKILLTENKDISEYRVELLDTTTNQSVFAFYDISGTFVRKADSQGSEADLNLHGANERGKLPVHPKELPSAVNSYVIINYPKHAIKESYILNNETYTNTYYIVLGKIEEKADIELWFDYQGTLIKAGDQAANNTADQNQNGSNKNNKEKKAQVRQPISQGKVPVVAVQYFTKKEPKAEEVRWDTIGKEYVVSYVNPTRNTDNRMHFDNKGVFVKAVTVMNPKNLLPSINDYLNKNYYDLEIESAENIVFADKKKYVLVKIFSENWMNDPMVFHELYFSTSGRLEKEVLADFVDAEDVWLQERKENKNSSFNEFTQDDDISLEEGEMVDGKQVSFKELPTNASKYITANFPGFIYTEGMIIDDEGVLKYSVYLKREGYKERKRVMFDAKGNFLKAEDI